MGEFIKENVEKINFQKNNQPEHHSCSPKISVIIPIYNVEKYLVECLESVISQTLKEIEIICINDGSTDNSGKILDKYATKDNRIRVVHKENEGVGKTRNLGIKTALGEFVCFMDPDDLYPTNDILEVLHNKAKENNVLIAGGEFSEFNSNMEPYEFKQSFGKSSNGYLFSRFKASSKSSSKVLFLSGLHKIF